MQPTRETLVEFAIHELEQLQREGTNWLPMKKQSKKDKVGLSAASPHAATTGPVMPVSPSSGREDASSVGDAPQACHPSSQQIDSIQQITTDLTDCQRCKLCKGRNNIVIGRGNHKAELMFIGEGPGRDEDLQGLPFVGRAGQLLDKIIIAMGFDRDEVYIANVVKCRPPENRAPEPDEIAACSPFLKRQIEIIKPKVICTLGTYATQAVLKTETRISQLRGEFQMHAGIPLMPTYHPAFLLRNPDMKRFVWEDVKKICKLLGRQPVEKAAETQASK